MTTTTTSRYHYALVTDFEATCDEHNQDPGKRALTRPQGEIIEFPLVLVDLSTRKVVDQRRWLVRPVDTPITAYCTQLTKLTWRDLEHQPTLEQVLKEADDWIRERVLDPEESTMVVTHGHYDVRGMLIKEARRKSLLHAVPQYWWRFVDITGEFLRRRDVQQLLGDDLPEEHPLKYECRVSLKRLCAALKVPMEKQLHSGIEDALLISKLLLKLVRDKKFLSPVHVIHDHRVSDMRYTAVRLFGLPFELSGRLFADHCASTFPNATHGTIQSFKEFLFTVYHSTGHAYIRYESHEDARVAYELLDCSEWKARLVMAFPATDDEVTRASSHMPPLPSLSTHAPSFVPTKPTVAATQWLCLVCHQMNFSRQKGCRSCRALKPGLNPATDLDEGEWICNGCSAFNMRHRITCDQCMSKNPNPPPPYKRTPAKYLKPGEWVCGNTNCHARNSSNLRWCYRCETMKGVESK